MKQEAIKKMLDRLSELEQNGQTRVSLSQEWVDRLSGLITPTDEQSPEGAIGRYYGLDVFLLSD